MGFVLLCGSPQPALPPILHHSQARFTISPIGRPLTLPRRLPRQRCRKGRGLSPRASQNGEDGPKEGSNKSKWESIRRGSLRFLSSFSEQLKKETGIDVGRAAASKAGELVEGARGAAKRGAEAFDWFRLALLPQFLDWNKWERWKDPKEWEAKRVGALILYGLVLVVSSQRMYSLTATPRLGARSKRELREAYMEAVIPDPSPSNIIKVKKNIWRKTMPKGLKIKKFIEGPDGTVVHDESYVGEDAWEDVPEPSQNVISVIEKDTTLDGEQKEELKRNLGIAGDVAPSGMSWRERLAIWKEVLRRDKMAEELDALDAKYIVDFDMQEVEKSLQKNVAEKAQDSQGNRALWISKRWWFYRPKLPYTYFLDKLDCSEVAAIVFSEDLKKLYVTMKEGFPLEYVVDIPLDPYLFEMISSSGVEVDLLRKSRGHYFQKMVIALAPGLLILYLMRESLTLLRITSSRFLYKRYNQLVDMVHSENFFLPIKTGEQTKSMYKEVVLGGDIWDLLDELMTYMRNPMQYFEKDVAFARGILLSGPPGTGKTLFARSLAKESGLPFVFASGAEFTDSDKSGSSEINRIFSMARRSAPSFVFVDEIDAIAGRNAKNDARRRATFDALLSQLDGEKETTGVDRCSLGQAVIFICATNRPEELDQDILRPGRIDRRVHIGLPGAKQRVQIFSVHGAGKKFADDVDFDKLVYRTAGFSGADIRNLVNEAAIMSVRKGNSLITQQDIVDVLDKQLLEGMGVLLTEEEQEKCAENVSFETKRLLAVHEAGHILLAHLFPRFDYHAFSQLLPGGKETSISVFNPRDDWVDRDYATSGYMMMQMVVAHGGRCAESFVFGSDITDGGKDDLKKISRIAREMVISPVNARLGLARLTQRVRQMDSPKSLDGEIIKYKWDDPNVVPVAMTVEVSELFTRELTRYIEETEEIAMNGLEQNKDIFDMIVNELLEKSRVSGKEVEEMMKTMSPVMFRDFAEPYQINPYEEGPLPKRDKVRYQPLDVYPAPLHRG